MTQDEASIFRYLALEYVRLANSIANDIEARTPDMAGADALRMFGSVVLATIGEQTADYTIH